MGGAFQFGLLALCAAGLQLVGSTEKQAKRQEQHMTSSLGAIITRALKEPLHQTKPNIERSDQMKGKSKITVEQRDQIVLFLHQHRTEFNTNKEALQAAFVKYHAPLSADSSSTLHRWFRLYLPNKKYNPALRSPSPGSPAAVLQEAAAEPAALLTSGELIAKYPEIIKQMAQLGTAKAFEAHPEWKALILPQIKAGQILYTAINTVRKQIGIFKAGKRRGEKTVYSREHFDVMTEILNTQSFRNVNGTKVVWELAFNGRADWAALFNWPAAKPAVVAYSNRVRSGKIARPGEEQTSSVMVREEPAHIEAHHPTNGNAIQIAGREYTLLELEKMIVEYREFLHAPKACPDCGYPLLMHVKAYNIALKHRRVEREF